MRARSLALDQTQIANGDPIVIPGGYGRPTIVLPRLGQKSFRLAVLGSYGLRCAVTGQPIDLPDLRYWSVAHQEAYASAEISLKRTLERNAAANIP